MLVAIQFNRQLRFVAIEVEDEVADDVLSPELRAIELAVAQQPPHRFLGIGLVAPKLARALFELVGDGWLVFG